MDKQLSTVTRLISCVLAGAWLSVLADGFAVAAPATVPLPPPRPAEFAKVPAATAPAPETPAPTPAPAPTPPQPTPEDNEDLRTQVLASHRVVGEALPAIADPGGCGIAAPLRVDAVDLADGHKVRLTPPAVMRASLASALADWLRDDLGQAVDKDDRLAALEGVGGYECRTRDRLVGATISQHGFGNALDIEAFVTAHGKRFAVGALSDADRAQPFMTIAMSTACLRFKTVLGPGADPYHALHLHVDLAWRRSGTRLCQWSVETVAANRSVRARP
jgi:hypothetical protein